MGKNIVAAAAGFAFAMLPLVSLAAGTRITVPGGTPVTIRMVDTIDSGTANVGDTFEFKADDDVVINGYVVIARGAEGRGEVTKVDRAGTHGHPGSLGIQLDYIYAVDGEKIRLDTVSKTETGEDRKGASSTATIIGYATLGIGGLFAHNFVKGRNITLDSSKTYSAFVDNTVHIVSSQRGAAPADDGFAH
jgi:hypothetical protein